MKKKSTSFIIVDILFLFMMIAPFVAAMILKILFAPASDGIAIVGAQVYCTIPMPFQSLPITESQVVSAAVIISLAGLCLFLTHGVRASVETKRQHFAEWIVEFVEKLVNENMGDYFSGFAPFVAGILALSAFSSLSALLGLYPPTSDVNIIAGWSILVFILITYYKMKCGPLHYIKSFGQPVAPLAPLNIISEIATPVSMTFRHYGNVLSGSVISVLLASALQGLSSMLFGSLPGFLGEFGWLRVGIPAVLSLYFDLFSGCLQAYIFAVLTMLYVAGGFPEDEYQRRQLRKLQKKAEKEKTAEIRQ